MAQTDILKCKKEEESSAKETSQFKKKITIYVCLLRVFLQGFESFLFGFGIRKRQIDSNLGVTPSM